MQVYVLYALVFFWSIRTISKSAENSDCAFSLQKAGKGRGGQKKAKRKRGGEEKHLCKKKGG